jgi:hypothetical protein
MLFDDAKGSRKNEEIMATHRTFRPLYLHCHVAVAVFLAHAALM